MKSVCAPCCYKSMNQETSEKVNVSITLASLCCLRGHVVGTCFGAPSCTMLAWTLCKAVLCAHSRSIGFARFECACYASDACAQLFTHNLFNTCSLPPTSLFPPPPLLSLHTHLPALQPTLQLILTPLSLPLGHRNPSRRPLQPRSPHAPPPRPEKVHPVHKEQPRWPSRLQTKEGAGLQGELADG